MAVATTTAILAGLTMAQAGAQADAQKKQGDYQRMQGEENARMAELQSEDALRRGDSAASGIKKNVIRTVADQRAAMAANGIKVDEGSALDLQDQTQAMGEEDVTTAKNNAWREAWGFKQQARSSKQDGANAAQAGRNAAGATLLTGALSAGSTLYGGRDRSSKEKDNYGRNTQRPVE
jgi:hypothetical protein